MSTLKERTKRQRDALAMSLRNYRAAIRAWKYGTGCPSLHAAAYSVSAYREWLHYMERIQRDY